MVAHNVKNSFSNYVLLAETLEVSDCGVMSIEGQPRGSEPGLPFKQMTLPL